MRHITNSIWGLTIAVVIGACTTENYETGDGHYSYMRAEFGMLHTLGRQSADYVLTDGGDTVTFKQVAEVRWAERPDSLYRALVYYDASSRVCFSAVKVIVPHPILTARTDTLPADPINVESVWKAGGFLNVAYAVRTGRTDNVESRQLLGVAIDTTYIHDKRNKTIKIRLLHAQNGVPEYYTARGYLSVPLKGFSQYATFLLSANTYKGEMLNCK
ncbi:hypothetical protein HMPREF1640_08625 [Prevotella sp. S7-1-8]|uniref:NigD1/NigD2 family lipoprotein n=1 Tax=Prevotella sp. S7-1-8 TaxID=1284775 RepID=UPI00050E839C|nr:NigD-like C-terminal domain-containing protein [Prevotella sp. S7-1-8]KGF16824.1 hypothetical protein HMPREF1640_08625 [Prevotella sp. S7-1-8]